MGNVDKRNGGVAKAKVPFDYKFELLKKEMETVQTGRDIYNRTMFAVKTLALTLFTVFVTLYTRTGDNLHPVVFVGVILVLVLLWIQDAIFKSLQWVYIERSIAIEEYLCSEEFEQDLTDDSSGSLGSPQIEQNLDRWRKKVLSRALPYMRQFTIWPVYLVPIFLVAILAQPHS